eukprot:scaffold1253_cov245-Pinguiococcus_pyrenoidosus.AAC.21
MSNSAPLSFLLLLRLGARRIARRRLRLLRRLELRFRFRYSPLSALQPRDERAHLAHEILLRGHFWVARLPVLVGDPHPNAAWIAWKSRVVLVGLSVRFAVRAREERQSFAWQHPAKLSKRAHLDAVGQLEVLAHLRHLLNQRVGAGVLLRNPPASRNRDAAVDERGPDHLKARVVHAVRIPWPDVHQVRVHLLGRTQEGARA